MYDAMKDIVKFNNVSGNTSELRSLGDSEIEFQKNLLEEEYDELQQAFDDNSLVDALDAAADVIVIAAGLIHKLGFNPNEVMQIVNECNLSKFAETKEEAEESVAAYENDSRYENVQAEMISVYDGGDQTKYVWVITGSKVGVEGKKILKGINTVKPEKALKDMVKRAYGDEKS